MTDRFTENQTPLDETTMAELREIAARYPQPRSGLLPMLHLIQSLEGRITPEGIEACAQVLDISAAQVSGVATFYTMYKRKPVGDYHVGVCTNTLCAVMGGDEIFAALKDHLDIGNDETVWPENESGKGVTLEHLECNAACDYAPVMMVNWEFMDNQTPQSARQLVDDLRAGREVHSTRGPKVCTWKQAARVLAGFDDGLANEGPSSGAPSTLGLRIARDNDWTATGGQRRTGGAEVTDGKSGGSHEASRKQEEAAVAESEADAKHEDNPTTKPGDAK